MNRRNLGGLLVLNIVLLVALGLLSFTPPEAEAQIGGGGGEYLMVAGQIVGQVNSTVYITDINNGALLAVTYDINRRALVPVAARDITADFNAGPRR